MEENKMAALKSASDYLAREVVNSENTGLRLTVVPTEYARHAIDYTAELEQTSCAQRRTIDGNSAAAPAAGQAGLATDELKSAILAIPCYVPADIKNNIETVIYKHGHRDALQSAAAIVATLAAPVAAATEQATGAHHLEPENIAAIIRDLREIEDGTTERPIEGRDWRTWAGVLARVIEHLATPADAGAGEGLTGADLGDLMTYPSPHGTLVRLADVKCRLAAPVRPASPHNLTDAEIDSITQHFKQADHYDSIRACVAFAIKRLEQRLDHVMRDLNGPAHFGEPVLARLSTPGAPVTASQPELTVWYGPMPESNGKSNFTAILMRKGGDTDGEKLDNMTDGITIDRSEYPDRVRYEADRVRYLIGELAERPFILDYDADKHSGYIKPERGQSPAPVTAEPVASIDTPEFRELLLDLDPSLRRAWSPRADDLITHIDSKLTAPADRDAVLDQAVNAEFPIPDNPHASVVNHALENRKAFRKGWQAALEEAAKLCGSRLSVELAMSILALKSSATTSEETAPADRDAIRDQALEDAAKACQEHSQCTNGAYRTACFNCAVEIRDLKSMVRAADAKGGEHG